MIIIRNVLSNNVLQSKLNVMNENAAMKDCSNHGGVAANLETIKKDTNQIMYITM